MSERIDKPGLSFWADELLHVWECPKVLRLPGGNPDYIRCGYLSHGPGNCPYDHGEPVAMVEITAVVLCSGCGAQIMRRDSRTPDGHLICSECAFAEVARGDQCPHLPFGGDGQDIPVACGDQCPGEGEESRER